MDKSQLSPLRELSFEELEEQLNGPPAATQLAPGVTLFTVDGSRIGNAIVVRKDGQTRDWKPALSEDKMMLDVWFIETDFGNNCRMTEREIFSHFILGRQHNYEQWWTDRADAMIATDQKLKEPKV
jgi:hypothetical protein